MTADKVSFIDWLERMDDTDIPDRQGPIGSIRQSMTFKKLLYGLMAKFVDSLPPDRQVQLEQMTVMNPDEYEARVKQMMGGANDGMPNVQQPVAGQQHPA